MFQGLVVTQAVEGVLELGQCQREPIAGGPPPQHPPEVLDDLELWAIAGQPVALQMNVRFERPREQGSPMPGGGVDHEQHARIVSRGIGPRDVPHVPCTPFLQGALP
jgi:hypothetical protein